MPFVDDELHPLQESLASRVKPVPVLKHLDDPAEQIQMRVNLDLDGSWEARTRIIDALVSPFGSPESWWCDPQDFVNMSPPTVKVSTAYYHNVLHPPVLHVRTGWVYEVNNSGIDDVYPVAALMSNLFMNLIREMKVLTACIGHTYAAMFHAPLGLCGSSIPQVFTTPSLVWLRWFVTLMIYEIEYTESFEKITMVDTNTLTHLTFVPWVVI